jgi:hypothetical protein
MGEFLQNGKPRVAEPIAFEYRNIFGNMFEKDELD